MIKFSVRDFSFVSGNHISKLHSLFHQWHIDPHLTQNAAISFLAVVDDRAEKIEKLALGAADLFDVEVRKGLSLLTIRHYTQAILAEFLEKKNIILRQQTASTIQVLF